MKQIFLLGIRFVSADYPEVRRLLDEGGLMVVPAAPALAAVREDGEYHQALQASSFAILDSGLLCLLLAVFKGLQVKKMSGLLFLRRFLAEIERVKPDTVFLINPSEDEAIANQALLQRYGYSLGPKHQYVSPHYGNRFEGDEVLLKILAELRPKYVIINLGGGVQEKLGAYLIRNLSYRPSVICTGAAIAFLTGRQASIRPWMDRFYLGWFMRCVSNPSKFVWRYLRGIKLLPLILREEVKRG
jgi:N-acetylglucosaminyldiphosphoundecaprenol N-acetyl-beta-D-mannosaminyltransferase